MRGGVTFSALLHLAVLVVIAIGLPDFGRDLEVSPPIPVEIVTIDDITRPKPVEKPQPKVEQPVEPQEIPEAPKPPPQEAAPPPPPPPEPVKQVARAVEPPPEPEPEPLPLPLPEPKAEPEPEPEPEEVKKPEPEPQAPRPVRKPPPKKKAKKQPEKKKKKEPEPDRLASILQNVDQLKQEVPEQRQQPTQEPQPQQAATLSSVPMTISEIDAVRQQINPCWNPPVGAPNAAELVVEVRIFLNQDGSLLRWTVLDAGRINRDTFHRVAAEAAVRAIKRCTPLQRLPPKKYSVWREITLNFDPSEILGQ